MLFGLALGAIIGRTYPAMAMTLLLFGASRLVVNVFIRPYYLAPLWAQVRTFTSVGMPGWGAYDSLFVGQVFQTTSGRSLTRDQAASMLRSHSGPTFAHTPLAAHGIVSWVLYQPGDRFWTFQAIEAGIFLALAALLVGLTVYWMARRVS